MITLKRISHKPGATFGVLLDEEAVPFAVTLENPWRWNQRNVSCIPPGGYVCERTHSPRFGETFEVMDVPERTHILFHKGNVAEDTEGCILVAEEFGRLHNSAAVLRSNAGFTELMRKLEGQDTFSLLIV